jgi:GNAT superfamily N-acetyltransferase
MMEEVAIRKFKTEDRESVRDIAWETAFIGEPGAAFFSGKNILADFLTLYFTDYEPDSCFVAVLKSRVVGYLIGCRDTRVLASIFKKKILAGLLAKFVFSGAFLRLKNLRLIFNLALSFFRGEFNMEEVSSDYPATLHINLKKDFRVKGAGARLISAFQEYLVSKGVKGLHLATMSSAAGAFFRRQGFILLSQHPRSYFRHLLTQDISVYIYVKKLRTTVSD